MSEATTITHLAGPLIRYVDHQRQRCSALAERDRRREDELAMEAMTA